jgi:hypothetical protein
MGMSCLAASVPVALMVPATLVLPGTITVTSGACPALGASAAP